MTTSPSWCCASPTKAYLSRLISGPEGIRIPGLLVTSDKKGIAGVCKGLLIPHTKTGDRGSRMPGRLYRKPQAFGLRATR